MYNHDRPFTALLRTLRLEGLTYDELSRRAGRVRSLSWFHTLMTGMTGPWPVHPPSVADLSGFARLTGVDEAQLRSAIAQEWYGVRGSTASARALQLAERLDILDDPTFAAIEHIVDLLATPESDLLRPTG